MSGVLCGEHNRAQLLAMLEQESLANIFMLADIRLYGFDKPFQRVWRAEEPKHQAVYLLFYDNLSVWGKDVDPAFVAGLAKAHTVNCVMGRLDAVAPLQSALNGYSLKQKRLCALNAPVKYMPSRETAVAAGEDVGDIFAFLATFPELRGMYTSQRMIADRIARGDGTHLILRNENGALLAHGNTAASTDFATMIGGVGALGEEDARCVIRALCCLIQQSGKTPCTLCAKESCDTRFAPLGFEPVCDWGTLVRE